MKKLGKFISVLFLLTFVTINLKAVPCEDFWPCEPPALPNNGWEQKTTNPIVIDGCPNCTITVTYSYRFLPCTNKHQLQMEEFTVSDGCRMCFSDGVLFHKAISIMLLDKTEILPQVEGELGCVPGIEVVNVSCWYWTGGLSAPWVMHWCNTDNCCFVEYEICLENGQYVIKYVTESGPTVACGIEDGNQCLFVCDWLPSIGVLARSVETDSPKETNNEQSHNNTYVTPNPGDNSVIIGMNEKVEGKFSIEVFNSTGKRINSSELNCKMSEPKITLDVSDLNNGVYLYNIIQDGIIIGNGKFVIKH